jgi:hypothetical protein
MIARTITLVAALACSDIIAAAQTCAASGIPGSCAATQTLSITVVRAVRVTAAPTSVAFASPTVADFDLGYSQSTGHVITVSANDQWRLQLSSSQATFTASGGARVNKPRGDLLWSTSAGGTFTAVSGTAAQIGSGTATRSAVLTLYYRIGWSWSLDTPGTYRLPLTLTVSAP